MDDKFNLQRFVAVQDSGGVFAEAIAELKRGRKTTHWIWFVFPQLRHLGRSRRAIFYGISCRREAEAYMEHPLLASRLTEAVEALLLNRGADPEEVLGGIDAIKVRSCLTLFDAVSPGGVFAEALAAFYGGEPDEATLLTINNEK